MPPDRVPVIVGVGEINDRPSDPAEGLGPAELMAAALTAADRDAGGGWTARCDGLLVVPQIGFRDLDVPAALARITGLAPKRIRQAALPSGDTPVRPLNDAANLIGGGRAGVCAITGGEALRTAAARAPGTLFAGSRATVSSLRHRYGLVTPDGIYALYENALRADLGQTLAEGQTETGQTWSAMAQVAAGSEGAWLKTALTPAEIMTPGPANRPIAFPFTKLTVANASVNQGAAVIVASLAAARAAGIGDERLVHIGAGAAAHEADEPLDRAGWTTPPAMRVSIERALALNGARAADLDMVELYSCFPCVPKMARRVLGWPVERPVTVHGGLTFGGGPIANYMSHALAAMVRRLRAGAERGLLYANGGHCSHNHTLLLSRRATGIAFPQDYDAQREADTARGLIPPLTDRIEGVMPVETYTVMYDRAGAPTGGVVLSRTRGGERVIARVAPGDAASIAWLTDGAVEPVGRPGRNRLADDTLIWEAIG